METYCQCKRHGQRTTQLEDFGLVHAIVYVLYMFFYFSFCFCLIDLFMLLFGEIMQLLQIEGPEKTDLRSKTVIPRLAKRIKELEEVLAFYESNGKWVVKKEKKSKCCNWKLIVMIVVVFFLFWTSIIKRTDDKCSCVQLKLSQSFSCSTKQCSSFLLSEQ